MIIVPIGRDNESSVKMRWLAMWKKPHLFQTYGYKWTREVFFNIVHERKEYILFWPFHRIGNFISSCISKTIIIVVIRRNN